MAKCLVLGANGFIGSHLVDKLVEKGYKVRAFGHFQSQPTFNRHKNVEVFSGDFLNVSDLKTALNGVDFVFHFISTTNPATSENDPFIDVETNVRATIELLQLCASKHVKRVIYASSGGAVYGENVATEACKEDDNTLPVSPYAIGKLTIENYLRYFNTKFDLDYTVFRIANPYGERQPFWKRQGVIPIFLEKVYRNDPVVILGDGTMVRDYVYVKDVVDMIVATLETTPQHHVYNLGSGKGYSVNELLEVIEKVTGKSPKRHIKPVPSTFVRRSILNVDRFMEEFGIQPAMSIEEGVRATYEYLKESLDKKAEYGN